MAKSQSKSPWSFKNRAELLRGKCVPCEGGIPPMERATAEKMSAEVKGWRLVAEEGKPLRIRKEMTFKDFKAAMAFVNSIAELAEREQHHPNILVHSWNKVRLDLYTHPIGGLSENDFIVAAKVDQIKAR